MPRISVVVPAHNVADTLLATLDSATRSGADEIIVVDDCSSDASVAIAEGVAGVTVLRRSEVGGPAMARNDGLRRATGEYVLFLDGDDELVAGALERLVAPFTDEVVAVLGRFEAVDLTGAPLDIGTWANEQLRPVVRRGGRYVTSPEGFTSEALVTRLVVPPPSGILIRRDVAQRIGGYDASLGRSEDIDFLVRLARLGVITSIDEVLVKYRRAPGQRSQATTARQRGRQWTLAHMVWSAPNRGERWRLARGAAAHHLDRASVRWAGATHVMDGVIAARSFLLGLAFRALGVAATLKP